MQFKKHVFECSAFMALLCCGCSGDKQSTNAEPVKIEMVALYQHDGHQFLRLIPKEQGGLNWDGSGFVHDPDCPCHLQRAEYHRTVTQETFENVMELHRHLDEFSPPGTVREFIYRIDGRDFEILATPDGVKLEPKD